MKEGRYYRGFTLLEVMVVLTIIGLLLSMVNLGGGARKVQSDTELFAQKLSATFVQLRDEAVFQNIDLALGSNGNSLTVLAYQSIDSIEFTNGLNREQLDRLVKNPWQIYEGRVGGELLFPEGVTWTLTIDDNTVNFDDLVNDDDELLPALLFLSSDVYSAFKIELTHEADEAFVVTILGDGYNDPRITSERFEEEA